MPKLNLKEKLDGKELDLSLSNISIVPVDELATIPKASKLDLSCNLVTVLPDSFCKLTHIVHLDLSKNQLQSLPQHFGSLVKLQWLDLYQNQLKLLPVSFSQLHQLKWLDLKDNPLEPELGKVAGECLDEKQCRKCATNVVKFMQRVAAEGERRQQEKLKRKREEEALRKAEEEQAKLERLKQQKKELKARRKKEEEERARQEQKQLEEVQEKKHQALLKEKEKYIKTETKKAPSSGWCSGPCGSVCLISFLLSLLVIYGVCFMFVWCVNYDQPTEVCIQLRSYLRPIWPTIRQLTTSTLEFVDNYVHLSDYIKTVEEEPTGQA